MRARRWLLLPALMPLLLYGCFAGLPDKGQVEAEPALPFQLGVATALSGPVAAEGRAIANAARLAAEHDSPVPVELTVVDAGCDAPAAEAAISALLREPRLLAVVGPVCSAGCVAAARLLDKPFVPMVTPRCTDISVTRQGYEGVFRTAWTDAVEAVAAANYVEDELHAARVFIVNDGTIYGRGVRDIFRLVFGKDRLAGNVEATTGTGDYGPVVRAIAKSSARAVYYAGFAADAARFAVQLRAAGVTLPLLVPDAVKEDQGFIAAAGAAAEGVYATEAVPEPGHDYPAFAAAYRDRFSAEPPPFAAEAYDAVAVLLRAAARTARGQGSRLVIDRRAFRSAVAGTDLQGASGRIRFRANGDRSEGAAVRVLRVRDGRYVAQALVRLDD